MHPDIIGNKTKWDRKRIGIVKYALLLLLLILPCHSGTLRVHNVKMDSSLVITRIQGQSTLDSVFGISSGSRTMRSCPFPAITDSSRASWKADTAAGSNRLDGFHKSYYDTVRNGAIFCDVPYVPYANSTTSYDNSIMKQMTNYLEITPLDTAYAALLIPDDYYISMTSDAAGYIYTIDYTTPCNLIRMTGAVGIYDAYSIKTRTWTEIYCDKSDNTLYATASYSAGNQGLYLWNNDSMNFIFYDSIYYPNNGAVFNGITTTQSGDLFICASDWYIYRQIGKVGEFIPYSDRRYWTSICARGDSVFAFTSNAGIFLKTPLGTSFVQFDATELDYGQSWIDGSENVYVLQNNSPSGIYRLALGTTSFELYHSYNLSNVSGGTYCNGNNYICTSNSTGDVFRYYAYYSQMINRLIVNGATVNNGMMTVNIEQGTTALNVNGKINCTGNINARDTVFLDKTPVSSSSSILVLNADSSIGHKSEDSVCVVTFDDSITINSNAANVYQVTLDSNTFIMPPTGAKSGKKIIFRFIQDNPGHRIVDWDTSAFRFSTDLEEPVLSIDSLKTDYLGFIYNANVSKWDLIGQVLGF